MQVGQGSLKKPATLIWRRRPAGPTGGTRGGPRRAAAHRLPPRARAPASTRAGIGRACAGLPSCPRAPQVSRARAARVRPGSVQLLPPRPSSAPRVPCRSPCRLHSPTHPILAQRQALRSLSEPLRCSSLPTRPPSVTHPGGSFTVYPSVFPKVVLHILPPLLNTPYFLLTGTCSMSPQ